MFIQTGCISGGKALESPPTSCELQGMAITIRNSTTSAIKRIEAPLTAKESESRESGDLITPTITYKTDLEGGLLLTASANAIDNGEVDTTFYRIPPEYFLWDMQGDLSDVGLRLSVGTSIIFYDAPYDPFVAFRTNFNGGDTITMVSHYRAASGEISVIGNGGREILSDVSEITLGINASSVAGDTVLLVIMSELGLAVPSGFTYDFASRAPGQLVELTSLERGTRLSVFRKALTAEDITAGEFTVLVNGAV